MGTHLEDVPCVRREASFVNAVKFMGRQPEPRIEVGVRQDEGEVVYFVRDNGLGIDPQYHEKIFGLFERLDATSGGTGIGLALIKRLVAF